MHECIGVIMCSACAFHFQSFACSIYIYISDVESHEMYMTCFYCNCLPTAFWNKIDRPWAFATRFLRDHGRIRCGDSSDGCVLVIPRWHSPWMLWEPVPAEQVDAEEMGRSRPLIAPDSPSSGVGKFCNFSSLESTKLDPLHGDQRKADLNIAMLVRQILTNQVFKLQSMHAPTSLTRGILTLKSLMCFWICYFAWV